MCEGEKRQEKAGSHGDEGHAPFGLCQSRCPLREILLLSTCVGGLLHAGGKENERMLVDQRSGWARTRKGSSRALEPGAPRAPFSRTRCGLDWAKPFRMRNPTWTGHKRRGAPTRETGVRKTEGYPIEKKERVTQVKTRPKGAPRRNSEIAKGAWNPFALSTLVRRVVPS